MQGREKTGPASKLCSENEIIPIQTLILCAAIKQERADEIRVEFRRSSAGFPGERCAQLLVDSRNYHPEETSRVH